MHPARHKGNRQLQRRADSDVNLGVLLFAFFELYGQRLNYTDVGLSVRDGGFYYNKVRRSGLGRFVTVIHMTGASSCEIWYPGSHSACSTHYDVEH